MMGLETLHEKPQPLQAKIAAQINPERLRHHTQAVLHDLKVLEELLHHGEIESGVHRIGAEQELFLVDRRWQPAPGAQKMLESLDDAHFTHELGRFNLEINLDPLALTDECFGQMEENLQERVDAVRRVASSHGLAVLLTGILPTLRVEHLTLRNMSQKARYFALNEALMRLRGEDYAVHIHGRDELSIQHANVMLEACNASFQVHYQVAPEDFACSYNTAQAIAGPVLAAAVNAPLLFGRRLWAETRIPLFQQSVDTRTSLPPARRQIPRVSFGSRWIETSVLEIFREDVARFPALFADEDFESEEEASGPPSLRALSRHNGTVYRWNRPCYGVLEGRPHLRIENRYLPSGPTLRDEVANSAFWCGLMRGVAREFPQIHRTMPFEQAQRNFSQAGREGLDARFDWMDQRNLPAVELIRSILLPLARKGLDDLAVASTDIELYLGVIEERVESGRTGSRWVLDSLAELAEQAPRSADLATLTEAMERHGRRGDPVAQWPVVARQDWNRSPQDLLVRDRMTADLFTVRPEQAIDLAVCLMEWRQIRHVPVEDEQHRFLGLVTYRSLLRVLAETPRRPLAVREVMLRDVVTVSPNSTLLEALRLLEEHQIGCLPVVEKTQLVGILSERDFLSVAQDSLEQTPSKASQEEICGAPAEGRRTGGRSPSGAAPHSS